MTIFGEFLSAFFGRLAPALWRIAKEVRACTRAPLSPPVLDSYQAKVGRYRRYQYTEDL
jgi:hypothetical protein